MKRHLISAAAAIFLLSSCSDSSESETRIRNITIGRNAASLPEAFPHFLVPNNAAVQITGVYLSETELFLPEGAARITAPAAPEAAAEFYYDQFRKNGWKVIQSRDNPGEKMIMAESRFGRLLTVLISGSESSTIKIYVKQLGGG